MNFGHASIFFICCFYFVSGNCPNPNVPNVQRDGILRIGVLMTIFEKDGKKSLSGTKRAHMALQAARDINRRTDILPSYKIELLLRDTYRQEFHAQEECFKLWTNGVVGLIGASSSNPTSAIASFAGLSLIKLVVMGFRAASPTLSNQEKYSTFVRINPTIRDKVRSIASLMQHFRWTCANFVYTPLDVFSTSAYETFKLAASEQDIRLASSVTLDIHPTKDEYSKAIAELMESDCLATVVVVQTRQAAEVIYAAHTQGYKGEFLMPSLNFRSYLRHKADDAEVNRIMSGIFAVEEFNGAGTASYAAMEKHWWKQPSTATMHSNGSYSDCSNTTDSTGYYTYRKDGKRDGECWGTDFDQARRDYIGQNSCRKDSKACAQALLSPALPYVRDAVFTLASGLHEILEGKNAEKGKVDGVQLHKAIKQHGFAHGITGNITLHSDSPDRDVSRMDYTVLNFQKDRSVRTGYIAAGEQSFAHCKSDPAYNSTSLSECKQSVFRDGTTGVPNVDLTPSGGDPPSNTLLYSIVAIMIVFLGIAVIVLVAFSLTRWYQNRLKKKKKAEVERLQMFRLNKNWSTLLQAEGVDGLSRMPDEWQSAIVPRESKRGTELHNQLSHMAKQLDMLSSKGRHGRSSISDVKASLRDFMEKEVAPFFASRNDMYHLYLLTDASSKSDSVSTPQPSEGRLPWPQKTSQLFKQVMFLLRDLDNMFKASYNQRFGLRVLNSELAAWTKWVENQLPALMPDGHVFSQSTSHLFELYPQAARVHSYYNKIFKRLAKETKAEWYPSKLKKPFRILEKAFLEKAEKAFLEKAKREQTRPVNFDMREQDVQNADREKAASEQLGHLVFDCSRVFDIVRGTLVFNTLADAEGGLLRGVRAIFESKEFQVIRLKDRFSNPTSACWRDVLINGRMVSRDGTIQSHVVEVQLHQRDLREERTMVGGHFIYERHRALFEACELVCGGEASAKLQDLHSSTEMTGAERRFSNTFHRSMSVPDLESVTEESPRISAGPPSTSKVYPMNI